MIGDDIRKLLRLRYASTGNGSGLNRPGEKWVQVEEARSGASWQGWRGQCDFMAIGAWESTGHRLIGHEIKMTMADWRRERLKPEKAERFRRYCHEWWLVAPVRVIEAARDEADPAEWGLMVATSDPMRLSVVRPSPQLHPEPLPWGWAVGWMAQLQRAYERRNIVPNWGLDLRGEDPPEQDTLALDIVP